MADKNQGTFGRVVAGVIAGGFAYAFMTGGSTSGLKTSSTEGGSILSRALSGSQEAPAVPDGMITVDKFEPNPDFLGGISVHVAIRNMLDERILGSSYITCRAFDAKNRRVHTEKIRLGEALAPGEAALLSENFYIGTSEVKIARVACDFGSEN